MARRLALRWRRNVHVQGLKSRLQLRPRSRKVKTTPRRQRFRFHWCTCLGLTRTRLRLPGGLHRCERACHKDAQSQGQAPKGRAAALNQECRAVPGRHERIPSRKWIMAFERRERRVALIPSCGKAGFPSAFRIPSGSAVHVREEPCWACQELNRPLLRKGHNILCNKMMQ